MKVYPHQPHRVIVFHNKVCTYDGPYSHAAIPRKGMMYIPFNSTWKRIHPINTGFRLKDVLDINVPKYLKMLLLVLNIPL